VTIEDFRNLALDLPEAIESSHQAHPDFRVRKKVFATICYPDESTGMVKLTPEQQKTFVRTAPGVFKPVNGAWGQRGATLVRLESADAPTVRRALVTAWRNIAPKGLAASVELED
jgi:hypothetical protein